MTIENEKKPIKESKIRLTTSIYIYMCMKKTEPIREQNLNRGNKGCLSGSFCR